MSKVTSRHGTTIAFDRSGEGPALVLVEGTVLSRVRADGPAGAGPHTVLRCVCL